MEDNEIAAKRHKKRKTYCTVMRLLRLFAAILAPFVAYDAPYQYNAMSLHLRGERPSVVFSLSLLVRCGSALRLRCLGEGETPGQRPG